jgi:excisionase family DNA binding protein
VIEAPARSRPEIATQTGPLELVTQAEAARLLGVSRQRVHQLVVEGRAPAPFGTSGSAVVWTREAVERWAERRNGHA